MGACIFKDTQEKKLKRCRLKKSWFLDHDGEKFMMLKHPSENPLHKRRTNASKLSPLSTEISIE